MPTLTRPDGTRPEDLHLSRRLFGGAFFAGYALAAVSAKADPVHTDEAGLITQVVQLPAADRPVPAYLARPDVKGRTPVVLVVSEVFGVHEYIRDICRRLAKAGYVALAPDFFVRHGDPAATSDFAVVREIVGATSEAETLGDIAAALTWLKAQTFADTRRMAVTGFCWGGAVVWLACARFVQFDCGVAWYGKLSRPESGGFMAEPERHWPLEYVDQLKAPVLGLYGGQDQGIPLKDVEAMSVALARHGPRDSDIVVYARSGHGFHADYRPSYDPTAAQDGWRRMLAFFAAHGVKPRTRT